jgi:hypothetical protein
LPPEIPGEGEEGKTVDSLAKITIMNLTEAQQTVKGMIEDATTALQQQPGSIAAIGNQPPMTGDANGEVSAESEALNLLRSINAGISELVPAVQALQQANLAGPEGEEGIEFPEPGGEGGLDADALNTGGEESSGAFGGPRRGAASREFGELGSEERELGSAERELGSAERELRSAERELGSAERELGSATSREGSASREFGSASRERGRGRFGRGRRNPTISGKED